MLAKASIAVKIILMVFIIKTLLKLNYIIIGIGVRVDIDLPYSLYFFTLKANAKANAKAKANVSRHRRVEKIVMYWFAYCLVQLIK